jgi:Tfp pilus assembly protein PilF
VLDYPENELFELSPGRGGNDRIMVIGFDLGEICSSYASAYNIQAHEDFRPSYQINIPGVPPNWRIQIFLVVKGDKDPVDKGVDTADKKTAYIKMYTSKWGSGVMTQSELKIRGPEVSIIIFEQASVPNTVDPYLTKKVLAFVQDELKTVAASLNTRDEIDENLLAKGAVQNAPVDSFHFGHGIQTGNIMTGYINPGKQGLLTLKVEPTGLYWLMGSIGNIFFPGMDEFTKQTAMCGWSNNKNKKFFFAVPYSISSDEDGGRYRISCNYKLIFTPSDGTTSSVLWSDPPLSSSENSSKPASLDYPTSDIEDLLGPPQLRYMSDSQTMKDALHFRKEIDDYTKKIEINPKDEMAYYGRGWTYGRLGECQKEIDDLSKLLEMNPNDEAAHAQRGRAFGELAQYQKAVDDYNKAIELNPRDKLDYTYRGWTYGKLGQYQNAIDDFSKIIELDPKDAENYNKRGWAYYGLAQYQKAIDDYNKAIELDPLKATPYYNRGIAYGKLGQWLRTMDDCGKAIDRQPTYAKAYVGRGFAFERLFLNPLAEKDWQMATRLGYKPDQKVTDKQK